MSIENVICLSISLKKTPVESILLAYRDLENFAGEMRCVSVARRLSMRLIYYVNEMTECVRLISLYEKKKGSNMYPSSPTIPANENFLKELS